MEQILVYILTSLALLVTATFVVAFFMALYVTWKTFFRGSFRFRFSESERNKLDEILEQRLSDLREQIAQADTEIEELQRHLSRGDWRCDLCRMWIPSNVHRFIGKTEDGARTVRCYGCQAPGSTRVGPRE